MSPWCTVSYQAHFSGQSLYVLRLVQFCYYFCSLWHCCFANLSDRVLKLIPTTRSVFCYVISILFVPAWSHYKRTDKEVRLTEFSSPLTHPFQFTLEINQIIFKYHTPDCLQSLRLIIMETLSLLQTSERVLSGSNCWVFSVCLGSTSSKKVRHRMRGFSMSH